MSSIQQIAKWRSQTNPLKRVVGGASIAPTLVARGQDDNAMMILYSPDLNETTNILNELHIVRNIE